VVHSINTLTYGDCVADIISEELKPTFIVNHKQDGYLTIVEQTKEGLYLCCKKDLPAS
jgi:hypothetical protein